MPEIRKRYCHMAMCNSFSTISRAQNAETLAALPVTGDSAEI
jgi:hypothetical protein